MTYQDLLNRVDDLRLLAVPPVPGEASGCMSSYDRRSRYDPDTDTYEDWAANDDGTGYIRRLDDGTIVAFEADGPGVIWRIWSALPQQGAMRVYLDDQEEPAIDVLVMDIELGSEDANGIDLVKRYFPAGCGTQVIYVTGFVEYCTSVYRTEHLYFLVKPFAQDDLDDALSRVLERLEADSSKPLSVRLGSRVVLVEPSRISYIESDRRKVRIHAGAEEIEAYASLSDLAAELPASFIQCHKSFLVNMDHVKELKADSVVLSSNQVVPVSQKRRKFVREAVFSRVQSKL